MNAVKERVKLISLQQNVNYNVVKLFKLNTQFGRQILVEFEECTSFLPKRVSDSIDDQCLLELNTKKLALIVKGQRLTKNGLTPLVEFIEV